MKYYFFIFRFDNCHEPRLLRLISQHTTYQTMATYTQHIHEAQNKHDLPTNTKILTRTVCFLFFVNETTTKTVNFIE